MTTDETKQFETFKKALWHSAKEMPDEGKLLLIKSSLGGYVVNKRYFPWIQEWCYIDDLIPNENDL